MSNFFEHIQDGISQLERQLEALVPAYVKVDDRSPHELLQQLANLSTQFNYYNFQNQVDGTWEEFFHSDLLVMLIIAGTLDFTPYEAAFMRIREALNNTENDDVLFEHTRELFLLLYNIGITLMDTLQKLRQADKTYTVWRYIEQVMEALEQDMTRLHRFEYQVIHLFPRQVALYENRVRPLEMTHTLRRLYTYAFENPGEGTEVFEGYYSLHELYDGLRTKFYQVSGSAAYYLRTQPDVMQHAPHIGLLLAFTELYKHLQYQLNKLPGRHLDFYFRQVLGIQTLPAVPDRVHIFVEPVPVARTFTVDKGQVLLAATPARKEPLPYVLQDAIKVHNIKIMALYSLYVSNYLQISAPTLQQQDIREAQPYLSIHPVIPAADYEKESTVIKPWLLLGEDQHDLPASHRSMEDTDIGFIIGSPVMFLHEGTRQVCVKLYFDPATFSGLIAYIKNFAQVSARSEAVVTTQLLSGAFQLYYTSPDGWEAVQRFSVKSNMTAATDNSLELFFVLDPTDKAWTIYNEKAHGSGLQSKAPLLKVLLNNASFHHPYSFLRSLLLERVCVQVKVTGHKSFRLQNNIGPLSPEHSFLLFGPQPYVGSYLDIRNSNVFNRFTRSFGINLEWLNLPRHETGFDAYYLGYDADLHNEAFKIGVSSLNNGLYLPERSSQQVLNLFQTTRDREGTLYLSDATALRGIDFTKLLFSNDMLLNDEMQPDVPLYRDGAIRLELLAPSEAFGHRLFSQVFPETIMSNAQKSLLPKKKKPVPNLPYVPIIKSLAVNYTLEHMEALKSVQSEQQGDGLEVYHVMPYGYRKTYPVVNNNTFTLVPVAEDMGNLFIGLDRLYPGEELSLLFQLEEKHYGDTAVDIAPLKWSHLNNNRWLPFERTQLLSDDTGNLVKSGIIRIRIPDNISNGNTMMDPSLYWLRISADKVTGANPRVIGIFPNAAVAERLFAGEGQSLNETLSIDPFAIKKFKTDIKTVQQVWQPFASFGGRRLETAPQYYTRVSERLRHKQRPVLGLDIAQVLLQQFPELLIVKSLPVETGLGQQQPEQPDISIVVVPAPPRSSSGQFNTLEPRVDLATLYRIQAYVQGKLPPFVKAEIRNPVYERIKVVCKVRFTPDDSSHNDNLYLQKLQEDIKHYLCPWLLDTVNNFKIGSVLYRSEMLNFINRLPYVNYVTAFSLVHFYFEKDARTGQVTARITDTAEVEVPFIRASVPEGVLIPSDDHLITIIESPLYEDPQPLGIDSLQVSRELLVGDQSSEGAPDRQPGAVFEEEMLTISIHPK
ncbi:MAG TPA: hypothetical protein VFS25_18530 [Chitinophaga sp.]|uniref:hypothetical protein n=1 Tax=Chitinophaga sp. TaxID=1869181 RepID=UPI002DBAE63C|nr:hypothetical protein [Chitinophaga sp.]HEU4554852.1 hypothetical protein [Chitinophaga sp.]